MTDKFQNINRDLEKLARDYEYSLVKDNNNFFKLNPLGMDLKDLDDYLTLCKSILTTTKKRYDK